MLVLFGADLVLPDHVLAPGTLVIEDGRIVEIRGGKGPSSSAAGEGHVNLSGHVIVPGFIDVHVHGVDGVDAVAGAGAVAAMAARLPRYGVTAFSPTAIACDASTLRRTLEDVGHARAQQAPGAARTLPAHLESNFVNPDYRGAQPLECLRMPPRAAPGPARQQPGARELFTDDEILAEIARARAHVGIVTLAPELPGGVDLVRTLAAAGHRVSLGHSGARYEEALAAIDAGARQATHLFNRMSPMRHRDPGLVGAALAREELAAELICDGHHVHPAVMRVAIAAKGTSAVLAITDGTAGSGLPPGSRAALGGRALRVGEVARFDDGTLAGSVLTMDRAFAMLVGAAGCTLVEAAHLCATTPARQLGLTGQGVIAEGAWADLAILDRTLGVVGTYVGGVLANPPPVTRP